MEAVAQRSGWEVVKLYQDAGIAARGGGQRAGLDAMMKAVNAKEFDMVASWSVDRLGRSLTDLLSSSGSAASGTREETKIDGQPHASRWD